MFSDFANHWVVVGVSADLRSGRMQLLMVAGERIVLFRDNEGAPAALIDRCPHRGVALSLAKLGTDKPTLAFRKLYLERMKGSSAASATRSN